jgi:hypothetical protein
MVFIIFLETEIKANDTCFTPSFNISDYKWPTNTKVNSHVEVVLKCNHLM